MGAEIDPIRLIRRIKNGLEIPGLKDALIKILQDFNLQISLLEGCQTILHSDCTDLARRLQKNQTGGFFGSGEYATCIVADYGMTRIICAQAATPCLICSLPLHDSSQSLTLLFLCRHVVHASCASGGDDLPPQPAPALLGIGSPTRGLSGKIAL